MCDIETNGLTASLVTTARHVLSSLYIRCYFVCAGSEYCQHRVINC